MNNEEILFELHDIEKIPITKMPPGMAISLGMKKAKMIRSFCGINEELLGPKIPNEKPPEIK